MAGDFVDLVAEKSGGPAATFEPARAGPHLSFALRVRAQALSLAMTGFGAIKLPIGRAIAGEIHDITFKVGHAFALVFVDHAHLIDGLITIIHEYKVVFDACAIDCDGSLRVGVFSEIEGVRHHGIGTLYDAGPAIDSKISTTFTAITAISGATGSVTSFKRGNLDVEAVRREAFARGSIFRDSHRALSCLHNHRVVMSC